MKNTDFVKYLEKAYARANVYKNNYPYNCGYYDGKVISWDCWNLGKTIIWSGGWIVDNYTKGQYQNVNHSTGLPDIGGYEICMRGEVSYDFTNIVPGEWLYCEGHIGYYIGDGTVIEDTIAWGANKIVKSKVSKAGYRTLDGIPAQTNKWILHSKIPWIEYNEEKEEMTDTQRYILDAVEDTVLGIGRENPEHLVKFFQSYLKAYGWYAGYIDGDYGKMTEASCRGWQKHDGREVTGEVKKSDWQWIEKG